MSSLFARSIPGVVILKCIEKVMFFPQDFVRLRCRQFAHIRELFGNRFAVPLRAFNGLAGLLQLFLCPAEQRRTATQIRSHGAEKRCT